MTRRLKGFAYLLAVLALLALPTVAWPQEQEREHESAGEERAHESAEEREREREGKGEETPLERAKEESGMRGSPRSRFELPAAELHVTAERLASDAGQEVIVKVVLERPVGSGTLRVRLPIIWLARARGGLRYAEPPRLAPGAPRGARLTRSGRVVTVTVPEAAQGSSVGIEVEDVGIPAGTYALPYDWTSPRGSESGTAKVVFYAPSREGEETPNPWARLSNPGNEINATADATEESESFIAVSPFDDDRIAAGINGGTNMSLWVSNNRGQNWTKSTLSSTIDAPGEVGPETGDICCDPTLAADRLGNIWFGGLSFESGSTNPSRIVVARVPPNGSSLPTVTTGLPERSSAGVTQDKPMMTIDNSPASPTYGRLYVLWDEPSGGGVNIVMSQCDTRELRAGGVRVPNAARCDNADNWSTPITVSPGSGSFIYADVAVGPDGRVYVVWWDFSSGNEIEGDTCNPAAVNCASAASWGTPAKIAGLDGTGGTPIPFACPILAQPGGRAAPSPQIDVDITGGPNDGRVYVTWSDLTGNGMTKCSDAAPPLSTHRRWDPFVASAVNALPGGNNPSTTVGDEIYQDANSDDWFPWLAVDQTTGTAWADFYSTRDDATRQTTQFYARSVTGPSPHTLGTLTRVSDSNHNAGTAPTAAGSDYSDEQCCNFGNDYGDYTGMDATNGAAFPVWTDNSPGGSQVQDGEAFTFIGTGTFLQLAARPATATEAAGNGDGLVQPGEPVTISAPVRNTSAVTATGVNGTLTSTMPGLSVTQDTSAYPNLAPSSEAANSTPFAATLPNTVACGDSVDFRLDLTTGQEPETVFFTVPVTCAGPPPPPPPPPPPAGAPAPPPPPPVGPPAPAPPPAAAAPLTLRVTTSSRRSFDTAFFSGIRATATCNKACSLTATLQLDAKTAKTLRVRRTLGRGKRSLTRAGRGTLIVKITKSQQARLRRARRLVLTLTVKATDGTRTRTVRKTITLKR